MFTVLWLEAGALVLGLLGVVAEILRQINNLTPDPDDDLDVPTDPIIVTYWLRASDQPQVYLLVQQERLTI